MKDGTTHKKSWLTESKINGLKGKSSDYVGKIYATYLAYLSSPDNAVVENAQKEYLTWGNGTRDECEPGMKDELTNYWNSVGWDTSRWTCSSVPWSAAFISYIMKTSGINFPYNAAHSKYFFDIKAAPSNYDCKTYDVHKDLDKLKAGDLLCRNREGLSQTYANLAREGSGHCDVVIEVGPTIVLIGGNVGDSVDKKTVTQSKVLVTGKDSYYGFISCL